MEQKAALSCLRASEDCSSIFTIILPPLWREKLGAEKAEINALVRKPHERAIAVWINTSFPFSFASLGVSITHRDPLLSRCIYMFTLSRPRVLLCSQCLSTQHPFWLAHFVQRKETLFAHINSSDCGVSLPWLHQRVLRVDGKRVAVESVLLMPLCHHLRRARCWSCDGRALRGEQAERASRGAKTAARQPTHGPCRATNVQMRL